MPIKCKACKVGVLFLIFKNALAEHMGVDYYRCDHCGAEFAKKAPELKLRKNF